MGDVKDILGVARDGGGPAPKSKKKDEPKLVKPKGMSRHVLRAAPATTPVAPRRHSTPCREAFALLSASHPLMPSQLMGDIRKKEGVAGLKEKARRDPRGVVTFEWRKFSNPARGDGLELQHWVKCYRDAQARQGGVGMAGRVTPADAGEYSFAKYNNKPPIMRYNDEEYKNLIKKEPGIEDLKARYYSVARQLLVGREGGPESVANSMLVRQPYNAQHERERKRGVEMLMQRSREQDEAENEVLAQAAQIEAKRKAEAAARRAAAGPSASAAPGAAAAAAPSTREVAEFTNEEQPGVPPLFDEEAQPKEPEKGAVARGWLTKELVEAVAARQQGKAAKALEGALQEIRMDQFPRCPTRAVCGAYISLQASRRELIELLELKRNVQAKQHMLAGMKRSKREEEADETPRSEKRQRMGK
ncbi:DNA methyltransferase 1-associated [Micractinium conductrix]|uniref:DNA methyltransferase 1-associated n=1 Tax=Micractinium conductrix TaxID=554055 RepID=A0A2P6VA72_9CHLO|nr:DNA methyltransferase 1-associated [Micractinium conductrix]PSC70994.1 DNA methyltransferase 1-associated [Micractinium conductrix]|eukprot:PSC69878.1 DNA methyltransferase 1-associated [Micractinium conductrix]